VEIVASVIPTNKTHIASVSIKYNENGCPIIISIAMIRIWN